MVDRIAPITGPTGYDYGRTPGLFDIAGLLDAFTPTRREIISPSQTRFEEMDGLMYPVTTPAVYGEPETGIEYMPAYRAASSAADFLGGLLTGGEEEREMLVEGAKAVPGAMAGQIEDYYTAMTQTPQDASGLMTPEGEVVEANPLLPMEYLLGGSIGAMRAGENVLGAAGGRLEDTALARQIGARTGDWQMSPEEAALYEAAAEFQLPRTPGETERLPQIAYEYGARTQDVANKGLLIDPGFQNLKRAAPDPDQPGTVVRDLDTLANEQFIDLQGLVGRTAKLMPGDMTMAGQEITHVMGVKLKNPVRMQGGKDFPREELSRELGLVWASHPSVISGYAKQARENPGLLGVYTAMGARSNDFSHHVADVLVDMTKQADWLPKEKIDLFDEKVRNMVVSKELADGTTVKTKPFEDFPGITSPKIERYIYSAGKGGARKAIADVMEKDTFRRVGFPDVSAVRAIVSDPSMRSRVNDPTGQLSPTGARIVEFDADPMTPMVGGGGNLPDFHKTYAQGISGQDYGTLQTPVPRILMIPDFYAERRLEGKEPSSDRRSSEIRNILFPITPQVADDVSVFGDMFRRGLTGQGIL